MSKTVLTNLAALAATSRDFQLSGPVSFAPSSIGGEKLSATDSPGGTLIDQWGELPTTDQEIIACINAMQPADAEKLTIDQVYYRVCEAVNSNYIYDRFMFLGDGSLKNVAMAAKQGFAFMNSHRTGGWIGEAEMPYGVTVAGRYEQYVSGSGELFARTLVGVYMMKGSTPNGGSGLSTDTIYNSITGGILRNVSCGMIRGLAGTLLCDVCGCNYYGGDCPHYAGSTYQMNDAQKAAQVRRGIPTGVATLTLENWTANEVSGVYSGAVPGAGFSKVHEALGRGDLPPAIMQQLAAAYALSL